MSSQEQDRNALASAIQDCFREAARKQNLDHTIEAIYKIFEGGVQGKLSRWKEGKRYGPMAQKRLIEQLIGIFDLKKEPARVLPEQYKQDLWMRLIRFLQTYSERNKILNDLDQYLTTLNVRSIRRRTNPTAGLFPQHIAWIISLVERAKKGSEILIECDSTDYGSFRDYDAHIKLVRALCKKANRGAKIKLLLVVDAELTAMSWANKFHYPDVRRDHYAEFLNHLTEFLEKIAPYEDYFKKAFNAVSTKLNADWRLSEGPIRQLSRLQYHYGVLVLSELLHSGVKVYEIKEALSDNKGSFPHFYWIRDEVEAIDVATSARRDADARVENRQANVVILRDNLLGRLSSPDCKAITLDMLPADIAREAPLLKKKIHRKSAIHDKEH